jgi:hypothetical protein
MNNKKGLLIVSVFLLILLVTTFTTAASPWKARLRIINQTGEEIYLTLIDEQGLINYQLKIPGEPFPPSIPTPTAGPKPTPEGTPTPTATPFDLEAFLEKNTTMFTIERKVYTTQIRACGVMVEGTMDLTTNLQLNLTPCLQMVHFENKQFLGEPTFEKPNWFRTPGTANWRFRYFLPEIDLKTFPQPNTTIIIEEE